jgi:hypothetical protein
MRRSWLILLVFAMAGVAVFFAGRGVGQHVCARSLARPTDDLDWLRLEFQLNDAELERVRQLHEGYLPKCHEYCAQIAARKRELQALLAADAADLAAIEQKLVEIGAWRAKCQAAMLQHFRHVSQAMPPEQGRRYLAQMQHLTLGAHEQIERSMSGDAPHPHGHH